MQKTQTESRESQHHELLAQISQRKEEKLVDQHELRSSNTQLEGELKLTKKQADMYFE